MSQSNIKVEDLLTQMACTDANCLTPEVKTHGFDLILISKHSNGVYNIYTHQDHYSPTTNSEATTVDTLTFAQTSTSISTTLSTGDILKLIPLLPEIDSMGFVRISETKTIESRISFYQSSLFPDTNIYIKASTTTKDKVSWEVFDLIIERLIQ